MTLAIAALLLTRCGGQSDAVELAFTSTPRTVTLGQPFSVGVQARDRSGHGTGTTKDGQRQVGIQLSFGGSPPATALGGPASAKADSDGNVIFQGLSLDIPGQYSLTASVPGDAAIPPVTSAPFTVVSASQRRDFPVDGGS